MIRMLIAEDKEAMRRSLVRLFSEKGHEVIEAGSGAEALERFNEMEIDLVITDLQMGEVGGLEVLREVKKRAPQTPVLMVTAFGTVESAVEAMRQGAFDYLVKPFSLTEIEARVEKALEQRRLLTENRYLRETLDHAVGRMIGRSERMQQVYRLIEKVAPHPSPVLILGETGTGKELVAREIQQMGPRKTGPFIAVNCGAIPENLLESELFGYEKGAFTGASAQKKGRLELAEGGTLFLDEIGELPLALQVKLLRFLQEREIQRVGGTKTIRVDVRLIAATNRDLKKEIQEHRFREDLYYRIRVIEIHLPPLRERHGDIPELTAYFLQKFSRELHKSLEMLPEALDLLTLYAWPGNVRELENVIERAGVLAEGEIIKAGDLPPELQLVSTPAGSNGDSTELGLTERLEMLERDIIKKTLDETAGNQTQAARMLRLHRSSLQYKMRKYGLLDEGRV
ncbi:MAG: sigma-54 dependent transcriptional regulator (plasmid) [Candidatus Manganitrophus sp.]|nr:sigma-54 dependent transcriptional regulator [Candidatus Manganitrophus sp.]MDC4228183.1 sigma-54 dependent transcriptional regulator [Candidatus Manganitrophus sp.]WDT77733.1 MAG: sigma-54 dependent transcriptional regulator [Candidatus Manganitrophus sp.]WDT82865.1 MAG: sigma-54 dependent transcriptional regulator [Candidatus Manganitrophus sp.]